MNPAGGGNWGSVNFQTGLSVKGPKSQGRGVAATEGGGGGGEADSQATFTGFLTSLPRPSIRSRQLPMPRSALFHPPCLPSARHVVAARTAMSESGMRVESPCGSSNEGESARDCAVDLEDEAGRICCPASLHLLLILRPNQRQLITVKLVRSRKGAGHA